MSNQQFSTISRRIMWLFDEASQACEGWHQVEKRRRQLPLMGLIQTLVMGCLSDAAMSLERLSSVAADLGYSISAAGLHQRLTVGVADIMAQLVRLALMQQTQGGQQTAPHPLQDFAAVYIVDSTQVQLPDHMRPQFKGHKETHSQLKLQLCFEYQSQMIECIETSHGITPDQRCDIPQTVAEAQTLMLMDLGYFKQERLRDIDQQGAYFVGRLQSQTALYHLDTEQRLDLVALLQHQQGQTLDLRVRLGGRTKHPVRLVAMRLPDDAAEERRRKAKAKYRRQGKTCSKAYLYLLGWHILITNLDHRYTPTQLRDLYAVRMQIEWLFRVYKSEFGLADNPNWRAARILCQFYARLLAIILTHWLTQPLMTRTDVEYSLTKCVQHLRQRCDRLVQAMRRGQRSLTRVVRELIAHMQRFSRKTKRRAQPSTLQTLLNWALT